ncbi:hypothetical protein MHBO_003070 [Bonamia ostreae]|uniref:Uncharacterized protein n=1 Tax=Bonamia ostreae TaxID=126728 RepID=A0ABV2APE3_9EUKA
MVENMIDLVKTHSKIENVIFISFWPIPLYQIRKIMPEVEVCLNYTDDHLRCLIADHKYHYFLKYLVYPFDILLMYMSKEIFSFLVGATMIGPNHELLSPSDIARFKKEDLQMFEYFYSVRLKIYVDCERRIVEKVLCQ